MTVFAAGGLALAAAACATVAATPRDELADAIGDRRAAPAERCVSTALLQRPRIIDASTIVYDRGATVYVNRLPSACPGLRPTATLIVDVNGSQLCRNDLVSAYDPPSTIPGPKCRLGDFVPYRRVR